MEILRPTPAVSINLMWLLTTLVSSSAWASDCPPDALRQARACTMVSNLSSQSAQGSVSALLEQGDAQKAYHACSNGDFLNVISCQERILERCKDDNTDAAQFLRNMIDVEKARQAITYFCTNVAAYMKHAKCIASHHREKVTCAEDGMRNFQTQLTATRNQDALLRFQCRFYFEALRCTEKVLTEKCSSYVSDIVTAIMLGFEPPICYDTKATGIRARNPETSYDVQAREGSNGSNDKNSASSTSCGPMSTFLLCLVLILLCVFRVH